MEKVIVIGGGASGIMAAISAARSGADVTLLEHTDRIGKKILSTGNGKCNYTNRRQGLRYYRGENPAFVLPVFEQFGFEQTVAFFKELGIFPKERDGYFYPASGQATSVLDVLLMELRRLRVKIETGQDICSVAKRKNGFAVQTKNGDFFTGKCIFACGGKAFPKSGSDGSAFPYIEKLGHTFIDVVPALVQMKAKQSFFKSIAGVRADISIKLDINGMQYQDRGEVQMTKHGISGIPSFQVSRYAARALKNGQKARAYLDFMPMLPEDALYQELSRRFFAKDGKTCMEALIGLFDKKLIPVFLKENNIPAHAPAETVPASKLAAFSNYLKNVRIDIDGTLGFDAAQASAGGVDTAEIDAGSLQSLLLPGLYFAGEVIDIDGMCGGYNLQWAWSSGYVAGLHAAGERNG